MGRQLTVPTMQIHCFWIRKLKCSCDSEIKKKFFRLYWQIQGWHGHSWFCSPTWWRNHAFCFKPLRCVFILIPLFVVRVLIWLHLIWLTYEYIWIIWTYIWIYVHFISLAVFVDLYVTDTLNSCLSRVKMIRKIKYSFKKYYIGIISSFSHLVYIFYCTLFLKSHSLIYS